MGRLTRRELLALGLGGFGLAAAGFFLADPLFAPTGRASSRRLPVRESSPILILAPHPDDEVLGSGGYWHQALRGGAQVHILVATSGDGFPAAAERDFLTPDPTPQDYLRLGRTRMHESIAATSSLGLPRDRIQFLGLPDGGTDELFLNHWQGAYQSRTTRRSACPYQDALRPGLRYSGENEFEAICDALRRIRPAVLVLPHPNDVHPDHWAMAAFADAAVERLRQEGHPFVQEMASVRYLVHWGDWPLPFGYHPGMALLPPWEFARLGTGWYREPLPPHVVRVKYEAVRIYRTQMAVLADRLAAFARRNELFGLVPPGLVGPWEGSWAAVAPVIEDPQATLFADLFGARSLVQDVRMALDMGRLRVRIALRGNAAADLVVQCHVMAFSQDLPQSYLRRRIEMGPGVQSRLFDDGGALPDSGLQARLLGRTAEFALPLQGLGGARDLIFGAVLLRGGRRIGKTAFRIVRLA